MKATSLALGISCLFGCAELETDPKATGALSELERNTESQHQQHLAAMESLEKRMASLEARLDALSSQPTASASVASAGDWIIWEVRTIATNPQGILVSPPKPKPQFAYSTQELCLQVAKRNAGLANGDAETQSYIESGMYGATWTVTLRCLPKGIDPR